MNTATIIGLASTVLIGLGLYGLVVEPRPLRKLLAFNLVGNGAFFYFGVVAQRGAIPGLGGDPVPQALVITGVVVAFAASALAIGLILRLFHATGQVSVATDRPAQATAPADAH
jgi:multicomponent Na+:H+ antiporter subunit C